MSKSKNYTWVAVVAVALLFIGVFWYVGTHGGFKGFTINDINAHFPVSITEINDENTDDTYWVTLSLNPETICVGDTTRGSVASNMPMALCALFVNTGSGYAHLRNIGLDGTGSFSVTERINTAGTATFRALCILNGRYQISNEVRLTVEVCDDSDSEPSYNCFDSDGGINFDVYGYCEDSYHNAGFPDKCENGQIMEWYCDDNGICQYVYGGSCPSDNQLPCSASLIPSSQAMCDMRYCTSGTCTFVPATLVMPAKCECK